MANEPPQRSPAEEPPQIQPNVAEQGNENASVAMLKRVQTYLTDGDNFVSQTLTTVEKETNVAKKMLLNVATLLLSLGLLFGEIRQQQAISSLLTVVYPIQRSVNEMLLQTNEEALKHCLIYWVVYASFETTESYSSAILPGYWFAKTVFLMCVYLPPINLAEKWYIEWIKPLSYLQQKKLNRAVMKKAHPYLLQKMGLTLEQLDALPEEVQLTDPTPTVPAKQAAVL